MEQSMRYTIYDCMKNLLIREEKDYVTLKEIYTEVASYLEKECTKTFESQIRGRLQEYCPQYETVYKGEPLFLTQKVRSGKWTIYEDQKKYIRYRNNKYIKTDDNWKTSYEVQEINEEYKREEDSDKIYKAKLSVLVGKDRSKIIIQELNMIRKLLKNLKDIESLGDGYGLAFEVFAISTIYNIDYNECINKYIVHGNYDGKIDAIYYNDSESIFIYQIKINDIDDISYDTMKNNYNMCLSTKIPKNGKDLYNFIDDNKSYFKGKKTEYRTISETSKRKNNTTPEEIYVKFFENKLLPINDNKLTLTIQKPKKPNCDSDSFEHNVSTDGHNNFTFYMKADKLIDCLLKTLGIDSVNSDTNIDLSKFFYDNVRGVLSLNKKMKYTIETEPENFIKYNNGISITGEVVDLGDSIDIKNPMINNGQQTITTLIMVGENLDKITLPIKITNENNIVTKGKISQFSNDQVKVKSIDMLSLNPYIRDIQQKIYEKDYKGEKYFLEIYSSGRKSYFDIVRNLYKDNNIIDLLDYIKLYFSIKDNKQLGLWKNSPNSQIEKTNINSSFEENLSLKVCEAIKNFEDFVYEVENKKEKEDFKSADLAFKYLLCKENLSIDDAVSVIRQINQKYYYDVKNEKSKLIDVYKSSTITNKLEAELKIYRDKKINIKV